MANLDIITYPHSILRRRADPVVEFGFELEKLAADMAETMYAAPGIGLAAPQIGISQQIAVVDIGGDEETNRIAQLHTIVNPVIIEKSGFIKYEEGCLSIPGVREFVERPSQIIVKAQDQYGKKIEIEAEGLLAVCLQHEIDHLNGILFIDHLSGLKKKLANKRLNKMFGTSKG